MFYIFVNRVSEREKGSELISQEGIQFGFYGRGYWLYFVGIFLFFINPAVRGLGSQLVAGPLGPSCSLGVPGSSQGEDGATREYIDETKPEATKPVAIACKYSDVQ